MQPIHRKQAANVLFVQTNVEITYKPEPETHITTDSFTVKVHHQDTQL